jgi:nitrate reductase delta subunit
MAEHLFEQLAAALEYPGEGTRAQVEACAAALGGPLPEVAAALSELRQALAERPLARLQELYTQTFDLAPACPLHVGYYLFGEDYRRGLFMAQLRERQEAVGLESEGELPDHLPLVLRWLARAGTHGVGDGSEEAQEMVTECLLPALGRMDEALAAGSNPYRGVLAAVAQVLRRDLEARGIPITAPVAAARPGAELTRPRAERPGSALAMADEPGCGAWGGLGQ